MPLLCLGLRYRSKSNLDVSKLTHIESAEHGWWYAARIPGNQLLVTIYSDADTVKALELQKLGKWTELLEQAPHTYKWVKHLDPVDDKVLGFGAPSFCLDRITGSSWLAIGDAASAYDPITSQGIIKGVTQGMRAATLIREHLSGHADALMRFEQEVKAQFTRYLQMRAQFYAMETRWKESGFWKRMDNLEAGGNEARLSSA